ncbi:alpha/beta hydrolase fold domain-containing protein [Streptomyces sp. SID13666]|uniref:alpha/beta hydrolase n=1 Tax=unclassified Streptomyces TaxID=2593676 RepID=UPI0013C0ADCF|nr:MULTISPECIES: alpha/beta hydrolase [unclassified Streptomyces]NEA53186.1 alpha/beta hydrolase fold domain-containing protein [Streptomyces sp. SID13666]NEA69487.1 alpha/beta hydrolase fold domain-containing protein [Streptomyces sp. SID13588]
MTGVVVYRGMNRATLDRQYSPSSRVRSLPAYLDEYRRLSEAARHDHPVLTGLAYGPHPAETLDYFPGTSTSTSTSTSTGSGTGTGRPPLLVFVHGGNWQALGRADSAFPAPPLLAAGAAVAVVEYGLAPDVGLDTMAGMVRRSVDWLLRHADGLGFAPDRLHLCGTSAGAQLAAMALLPDPFDGPDVSGRIAGAVLLSGIYDLEPVRLSYVNEALRLDEAAALRNSPLLLLPPRPAKVVVARGGNETEEYIRQHERMVGALRPRTAVREVVADRRNHFDLPYDLGVRTSRLGSAVLAQMGLEGSTT